MEVIMYAIVEYTDNTMEKFFIMEIGDNYIELDKKLQKYRKFYVHRRRKKLLRVVRIK
jgi:hypothetical protein